MAEENQSPPLLTRSDVVLALLVGGVSLGLYLRTLAPWALPGDSGEFQVLAYQVGIAHTTGYPVYILLAKLFISLFPAGDVAYRVNLFSAVMGALTVAGVYLAGRLLTARRWAGLLGALALMVSPTFWSQSLIAEVYTAGAAFLVAVWVALLAWHKTNDARALFLAGLCGGVGLGAHANLAVAAPAVAFFLLLHRSRWRALWKPALLGALAGVGLFLASFVIVDLNASPANAFNAIYGPSRSFWGLTEDDLHNPAARIAFLATAVQWRGALFANPSKVMPEHVSDYVANLPNEFSLLTLGLAALGLAALLWQDRRLAALFGSALALHWIVYFNYRVGDIQVFYIPGYVWMAMLAGVGAAALARLAEKARCRGRRILETVVMPAIIVVAVTPILSPRWEAVRDGAVPFLNARGFVAGDETEIAYKVVANLVRQLEPNSILFTDWQRLYLYYYAAHVAQQRLDLQFVETYPHAEKPGLASSIPAFIRANIDARPIYLSDWVGEIEAAGLEIRPVHFGVIRLFKVEKP